MPRVAALIELAGLIERDLAQAGQGQIDLKAVDKLRATIQDPYELGYFDLFLARYLQTHGKRDDAIRYWKERIAASYALSYCRTQAGAALRELGLTPESSKTTPERATPSDAKAASETASEGTKQGEKESEKERGPEGTKPSGTGAKPDA